jgi:hypothetical protein
MQWAFGIGAVVSVGVLALSFRLPGRAPAAVPAAPAEIG